MCSPTRTAISVKVYAGPFQITGDLQKAKDKWVTVGIAYSKNKDENYYAFLKFDGAEPYLKKGRSFLLTVHWKEQHRLNQRKGIISFRF